MRAFLKAETHLMPFDVHSSTGLQKIGSKDIFKRIPSKERSEIPDPYKINWMVLYMADW